jgi:AcrR family transcriptional regulator
MPRRPLRRDAERNRRRILDAAEDLFAQRGLTVTLNDIAHHAGVGVGTVYRRFPDRTQLIESLFERKVEEIVELLEQACGEEDPWRGLASFLERLMEHQSRNIALRELMIAGNEGCERIARIRSRLTPLAIQLMQRAKERGELRADAEVSDLAIIQLMLGAVIDGAQRVAPDLWRRYLDILLQGLQADPQPPVPLRQPALAAEQVDEVCAIAQLARR